MQIRCLLINFIYDINITSLYFLAAPAHRARDTIELLRRTTPDFIAPDVATETKLTRPKSSGLVCHSATCV